MSIGQLLTSRRNFLIRASAITAAGAIVTVPIVTVEDARARARHHLAGLERAMSDLYPEMKFTKRLAMPNTPQPKGDGRSWPIAILVAE
jgi:hypothetical protein